MKLSEHDFNMLMEWFRIQNIVLLDKENSTLFSIEEIDNAYLYDCLVNEGI